MDDKVTVGERWSVGHPLLENYTLSLRSITTQNSTCRNGAYHGTRQADRSDITNTFKFKVY